MGDAGERIQRLLEGMTLEEKTSLVAGDDMWHTRALPRLGIPRLKLTDGPNGARGGLSEGTTAACFPCGAALAATWNPELVERVGVALAEEARTKGAHVLLAPTVNTHRSPLAGRNFECYSEDPFLASRVAVAFVRGVQSQGVGASVKHFVCNDSEFERFTISSEVGERALREIYLPPFEAAVREADVWMVMAAYNRVNGTHASEHEHLLGGILKEEWGFQGCVVSDWFGTRSTVAAARAGLDLEMPGPGRFMGPKLLEAVLGGEVSEDAVDDKVRRLLRVMVRTGCLDETGERPERAVDRPEHRALARETASQATVLLKNEAGMLPLERRGLRSLAVIGPNASVARIQGGGSARVRPHYAISPLDALHQRCGDAVAIRFEPGCTLHKSIPALDTRQLRPEPGSPQTGFRAEYWNDLETSGAPALSRVSGRSQLHWFGALAPGLEPERFSMKLSGSFTPRETGSHLLSLCSAGRSRLRLDGELLLDNWTNPTRGDAFFGAGSTEITARVEMRRGEARHIEVEYSKQGSPRIGGLKIGCLPPVPEDLMERAVEAAAGSDVALCFVGMDEEWESEGSDRPHMDLPGRQGELIEKVVAANPRTVVVVNAGAAVRMDWTPRVPALLWTWYGGQESGTAIADVLFGSVDPGGRLPTTLPRRLEDNPAFLNPGECGKVVYGEGIFVGYRYYDKKGIEPLFPFGHGLSYASFRYGPARLSSDASRLEEPLELRVEVTNTGSRPGLEVVQVYVHDAESSLLRPEQELAAFAKVALEPGEQRELRFRLERRAFSCWDPRAGRWRAEPGEFEIRVGSSSRDLRSRTRFRLEA